MGRQAILYDLRFKEPDWRIFICPIHGIIHEDNLIEGYGDYTGEFFCEICHDGHRQKVYIVEDIRDFIGEAYGLE